MHNVMKSYCNKEINRIEVYEFEQKNQNLKECKSESRNKLVTKKIKG